VVRAKPPITSRPLGAAGTSVPSGMKPRLTMTIGPFSIWKGVSTLTPFTSSCVRLICTNWVSGR
jgi:hypothetical protein